ncbi:hypothetical protein ACFFJX_08160 [Pseudarcicella hirudinis]|uniref:hypothetical protein n=1 Tax=Pseudarcicella hirudinis TaxID=1079859 RepID=UPI000B874593
MKQISKALFTETLLGVIAISLIIVLTQVLGCKHKKQSTDLLIKRDSLAIVAKYDSIRVVNLKLKDSITDAKIQKIPAHFSKSFRDSVFRNFGK